MSLVFGERVGGRNRRGCCECDRFDCGAVRYAVP